jgi:thiamine kinase-like enzyme
MTISPELDALLDRITVLHGLPRTVEVLSGGLTNHNYKVRTSEGAYVVRVSPQQSELLSINRANEHHNSLCAARAGIGAPVIEYRPQDSVLVVGLIDGVTLTESEVRQNIKRIAESCRRLHSGPRFANDFDMFQIQQIYLEIVQDRGFRIPDGYFDFEPHVSAIADALAVQAEPTVPCNNDLLAGNFIDDGNQIWLIDYEYSGNNDACFELGNIWSENKLSLDQLGELVTAYYGRRLRNKLARAQLQGLMSRYGWTLWASIQDGSSALDFDFWSWGMEKYDAAVAVFTSAQFQVLLTEAQRPD